MLGSFLSACSSSFEARVIPDTVKHLWTFLWLLVGWLSAQREMSAGSSPAGSLLSGCILSSTTHGQAEWRSVWKSADEESTWVQSDKAPLSCSFTCIPVPHVGPLATLRLSLQTCLEWPSSITAPWVFTACELQLRLCGRCPGKFFCQKFAVLNLSLYLHLRFPGMCLKLEINIANL